MYFVFLGAQDGTRLSENGGEEDVDVFDFLTQLFGFQRDSVRNQRCGWLNYVADTCNYQCHTGSPYPHGTNVHNDRKYVISYKKKVLQICVVYDSRQGAKTMFQFIPGI